MTEAMQRW